MLAHKYVIKFHSYGCTCMFCFIDCNIDSINTVCDVGIAIIDNGSQQLVNNNNLKKDSSYCRLSECIFFSFIYMFIANRSIIISQ